MSEEPVDLPVPYEDGDFWPKEVPEGARWSWKRDREASRLAAIGYSPQEIAEKLKMHEKASGLPDERIAIAAIRRGLSAVYRFTADEIKLQELESLDAMERHLWQTLRREHVLVQQGRVIMIEGQLVQDERFVLETLDRILKLKERRARYLGLDAQVRVSVEADQIGGEIAALIAAINASDEQARQALGVAPPTET